jgi:hypothetical protein
VNWPDFFPVDISGYRQNNAMSRSIPGLRETGRESTILSRNKEGWVMEPSQYFSMGVLTICVIHLVSTAWEGINAWWNEIVQRKNLTGGLAMKFTRRADAAPEKHVQQRSDWYAFFHCSDLVGPETLPKSASAAKPDRTVHVQKNSTSTGRAQGSSRRHGVSLTIS